MNDPQKPWLTKAIHVSIAGFLFSLVLSAAMTLGAALHVPMLQAVERAGVDFAMRAYVAFAPWVDPGFERLSRQAYAFVDVDESACRAYADLPGDCAEEGLATPGLLADFVLAAQDSGASVVIIDAAPPADAADRAALVRALSHPVGPWVIAPLASRPLEATEGLQLSVPSARPGDGLMASGRLRLAPIVTTTDPTANDGVVRHFPVLARVLGEGAAPAWIPTAPYLAAALSHPRLGPMVDCHFYRRTDPDCQRLKPDAAMLKTFSAAKGGATQNRILYSLPSLAVVDPDGAQALRARYLGRYERYVASRLLVDGRFEIPEGLLEGKIVVVGSSASQSHDRHPTPIGVLPGAEIVLNSTRSFREFGTGAEVTRAATLGVRLNEAGRRLGAKVWGAFVGACLMSIAWLSIYWLLSRPKIHPFPARVLASLIFVGVLGSVIIIEMVVGIASLRTGAAQGQATDLLTPLLALGLEGYAEAAKAFSDAAERGIARIDRSLRELAARVVKLFASKG